MTAHARTLKRRRQRQAAAIRRATPPRGGNCRIGDMNRVLIDTLGPALVTTFTASTPLLAYLNRRA